MHARNILPINPNLLYDQFIVVMSGVNYTPAYYGDYTFPSWAEGIGWILAVVPVAMVIIGWIYALVKFKGVSWFCGLYFKIYLHQLHEL